MPKLECADCHKQFLHAAKKTVTTPPIFTIATTTNAVEKPVESTVLETHVCPFCGNLNLSEVVEALSPIESVKSVDLAEVDAMIQQGYEVHELYARTATVIKRKKEGTT